MIKNNLFSIIDFRQSLKYNDLVPPTAMKYNTSTNTVEQLQPEIFLPPSSSLSSGTLLISRDGEDDINSIRISTARTSTSEIEYRNNHEKPRISSKTTIPNDSSTLQDDVKTGCDIFILLRTCWSWFCGLDDQQSEESLPGDNISYHQLQRRKENGDVNDAQDFMLQHIKERPLIKWILNINLIILILIEISLFLVFSLPVQYTFWRE